MTAKRTIQQRLKACAEAELEDLAHQVASRAKSILTNDERAVYAAYLRKLAAGQAVEPTPKLCAVAGKLAADPESAAMDARWRALYLAFTYRDVGPIPHCRRTSRNARD